MIAAGGVLGAVARYGVASALPARDGAFPWATFAVNVSGSAALGVVLVLVMERRPTSRYLRPFTATGFLGAYTTFSTMVVEGDVLARDGHVGTAALYVVASLAAGLAAARVGVGVGRELAERRR